MGKVYTHYLTNLSMIISFDGVSAVGKTTLIDWLVKKGENAVMIREDDVDPYREFTLSIYKTIYGQLNGKSMNEIAPHLNKTYTNYSGELDKLVNEVGKRDITSETIDNVAKNLPAPSKMKGNETEFRVSLVNGLEYSAQFDSKRAREVAFLSSLFAIGRKYVDDNYVKHEKRDLVLDRWTLSGLAGQAYPEHGYSWQEIKILHEGLNITLPDVMFAITANKEALGKRREERTKNGTPKPYDRGLDRELKEIDFYDEICSALQSEGKRAYMLDNSGDIAFTKFRIKDIIRSGYKFTQDLS